MKRACSIPRSVRVRSTSRFRETETSPSARTVSSSSQARATRTVLLETVTLRILTRLFGCGNSVNDFQLTGMINEGEMRHNVIAFNTEQVVTGTKQVLKLQRVQQISQQIPEVQSPRTCHDLTYEYPQVNRQSVNSRQEMREIMKSYMQQPRSLAFIPEITEK